MESSKSPLDGIWSLCDGPETHAIKPESVTIEPSVPRAGRPLHVLVRANTDRRIEGGKMILEIRLGFIKLKKEFGLCQVLGDFSDVKCPIEKGPISVDVKTEIPDVPSAVPLKGNVKLYAEDGALLTCVDISFKLERGL